MPKFLKKTDEKVEGKKATFNKKTDYKAVKLLKSGRVTILHVEQANGLIAAKKAEEAKGVKVDLALSTRTVTVDEEANEKVK